MLLVQAPVEPVRLGNIARQLTNQDIAAFEAELGEKPWLLNGDPSQDGSHYISAYLPPSFADSTTRWGGVVTFSRFLIPTAGEWKISGFPSWYAQVALPGRPFDQIQGDQDVNRPFKVIGRIGNDELIQIVTFLRSAPRLAAGPGGIGGGQVQLLPILSVTRLANNSVSVVLRSGIQQGQRVVLEKRGGGWVVTDLYYFYA